MHFCNHNWAQAQGWYSPWCKRLRAFVFVPKLSHHGTKRDQTVLVWILQVKPAFGSHCALFCCLALAIAMPPASPGMISPNSSSAKLGGRNLGLHLQWEISYQRNVSVSFELLHCLNSQQVVPYQARVPITASEKRPPHLHKAGHMQTCSRLQFSLLGLFEISGLSQFRALALSLSVIQACYAGLQTHVITTPSDDLANDANMAITELRQLAQSLVGQGTSNSEGRSSTSTLISH